MKDTNKILKDFQDSIGEISKTFKGFGVQMSEMAKEAEKNLTEKEKEFINDFKKDSKTLKSDDVASLIKLRDLYLKKLKDGI